MLDNNAMPHDVAVTAPALMIVAKAVAVVPTCTERLLGKTAAINVIGGLTCANVSAVDTSVHVSSARNTRNRCRAMSLVRFIRITLFLVRADELGNFDGLGRTV